jgi:hypothetical protein
MLKYCFCFIPTVREIKKMLRKRAMCQENKLHVIENSNDRVMHMVNIHVWKC